jgi:hypothetical protein
MGHASQARRSCLLCSMAGVDNARADLQPQTSPRGTEEHRCPERVVIR